MVVFVLIALPVSGEPAILFQKSFSLFKDGRYTEAAEAFGTLSRQADFPEIRENAAYMEILSLVNANSLPLAKSKVSLFLETWRESEWIAELRYQDARILFLEGNLGQAMKEFSAFLIEFPDSPSVSNALFWYADALYLQGSRIEAFHVYEEFCKQFPGVEKFQIAESRMESIKYEIKESSLLRRFDFNLNQALREAGERQVRETDIEQAFERLYRSKRRLKAAYVAAPQILVVEAAPIELQTSPEPALEPSPVPVPLPEPIPELAQSANAAALPPVQAPLDSEESARLQRLAALLEIKRQALELLTRILLEFAREVTK
jgi:tetratricopeptide (TPR) repeat protein